MNRAFLLILTVSLFGCPTIQKGDGADDTGPGGEEGSEGETPGGSEVSIADIQNGLVADGDLVTVSNVIVTSALTAEGAGFFVQDAGGGPFSGMYIYTATMTEQPNIHVGDELTITGMVSEYYDFTEVSVTTVENIAVTGEGEPVADVVSAGDDWEKWESCLVTLEDQTVTSGLDNYGEAELSGGILLDNLFFDYQAEYGATFESVTGLVHYNFEEFKLAPREEGDLEGYTPGQELEATVSDVQQGVAVDGSTVTLNGLIVTSELTYDETGFFVQDEGGGPWSGIYVFVDWADDEALDIQVGDAINLTATVSEYYDLTELAIDAWADVEIVSSGNDVTSEVLAESPPDWEMYEGVLVTLEGLTLASDPDSYGESVSDWDGLNVDDLLYDYGGSEGTTYETITGVIHFSYEQYKLLPRSAEDIGGEGGDPDPDPDPGETVTIAEIQGGDVAEESSVTVEGAIVTAVGEDGFFAQDAGGGAWSGIYVYVYDSGVSVGDVVTFTGAYTEYYDLSEVAIDDAADISVTGSATPTVTDVASAPADWEMYEGVLIRIEDVEADGVPDSYGQTMLDIGIYLDDLLYDYDGELEIEAGMGFDSITGPLYYSFEEWKIVPRGSSDVAF